MKILYLTLSKIELNTPGIYSDLVNALKNRGHKVTIVQVCEPKDISETILTEEEGVTFLKVLVGELFGVNFIKKGINTLKVEPKLKAAISRYLKKEEFDLVLYATPPITFSGVVKYAKRHYGCKAFLMLKDIFPQNAVDIGLFSEKSPINLFFRQKEKSLYRLSDVIGCMSEANRKYVLDHNPSIPDGKVILFPNTQAVEELSEAYERNPEDPVSFVFGGNFGKPQAIDFLMEAIGSEQMQKVNAKFVFIGNGSEKSKVVEASKRYANLDFYDFMPPREYDALMKKCDVGLISLDARFTIPNYPSRTLSYMAQAKPILACTDRNTDIKELVTEQAGCGLWCASDDVDGFVKAVSRMCDSVDRLKELGQNGRAYFVNNFNVNRSVEIIENI